MGTKPNILVFLASPRRNRHSETLANRFLKPLEAEGCTVTRIHVPQLAIRPCTACDGCRATGACVLRDDMDRIYGLLDAADWVVLASPVYFNSVTGSLKVLIDRCQVYWARKFVLKRPPVKNGRQGFLLMSAGISQSPENLDGPRRVADYFFKAQDIGFAGMCCTDRTDSAEEERLEAANRAAETLGRKALEAWGDL